MFETIPMRAGKVSLHCNGGRFRGGLAVARVRQKESLPEIRFIASNVMDSLQLRLPCDRF